MEERQNSKLVHKISFENRGNGFITGVKDVLSFDASEIVLETELGILMLKGLDLHVTRLMVEKGEVEIDGQIDSLMYSEMNVGRKRTEGIIGRLFK